MATFIGIVVTIIIISIVFVLYVCIIVGNESKTEKEQLYENIIKFAITNHIGGLHGGMMIDYFGIDKMKDLKLDIERNHFEHAYIIRVR